MGAQHAATPLSDIDREILKRVQGSLPDSAAPYADIAAAVGTDEAHVLDLLSRMAATGEIRRFGATLKHQKAGFGANVMVAWYVPEEDVDRIGAIMAKRPEISLHHDPRPHPGRLPGRGGGALRGHGPRRLRHAFQPQGTEKSQHALLLGPALFPIRGLTPGQQTPIFPS